MQQPAPAAYSSPSPGDDDLVPTWLGPTRIGIGLFQGLLLYLLYTAAQDKSWPATVPLLFGPLAMLGLLLPVIVISGLGHLSRRQLTSWAASAAAVIALLAAYDMWRRLGGTEWENGKPSGMLTLCLAVGFFIAHALVLAASREGRRIAAYASYFEVAWKLNLQILFCLVFVGATWAVLQLGAALFDLVKLNFLSWAIGKPFFFIPVTAFAFSVAMHLTDVKPAIVRGIRNLLHVLLSWILPVLTLLVGGFLASLPFTGLEPLWATRSAGGILLSAAAAFVILINAAYQDGASPPARVLAVSARIACLLLVPLTLLAAYALALRVNDHGWSADRVIAGACLLVAACYAGGYAAAALRRGWLRTLAGVNIAAAFVVLAVLALLLSPVLDPARIAVDSQMARLASGQIKLPQLDVAYLHHQGARFGREAIAQLEKSAAGDDAGWLRTELARLRQVREPGAPVPDLKVTDNLRVWPAGTPLPAGFAGFDWQRLEQHLVLPYCLQRQGAICDAFVIDLGGDARPEVILVGAPNHGNAVLRQGDDGAWIFAGALPSGLADCAPLLDAMRAGKLRVLAPTVGDLEIDGRRLDITPRHTPFRCGPEPAPSEEDAPRRG